MREGYVRGGTISGSSARRRWRAGRGCGGLARWRTPSPCTQPEAARGITAKAEQGFDVDLRSSSSPPLIPCVQLRVCY